MSSNLTPEQRQRIEENRQKALRLLQQNNMSNPSVGDRKDGSVTGIDNMGPSSSKKLKLQSHQDVLGGGYGHATRFSPSLTAHYPVSAPEKKKKKSKKPPKRVVGCAVLISKNRFKVEIEFNELVVEIFKTIPGAHYDPAGKVWDFPLDQHAKLLDDTEVLEPAVKIERLPKFILKVFQENPKETNLTQHESDLSKLDKTLLMTLLPFQKEGIAFAIGKEGRVIISYEKGLGKMIQALGITHFYVTEWPMLIVTTMLQRGNWKDAIRKWLPSISLDSVYVMNGELDEFGDSSVVIMSYTCFQQRYEGLSGFKVVIFDDAHLISQENSNLTEIAVPFIAATDRAVLLTTDPGFCKPINMFPLIASVKPSFVSKMGFTLRYCIKGKYFMGCDINEAANIEELKLLLQETCMILREKKGLENQVVVAGQRNKVGRISDYFLKETGNVV